VEAVDNDMLAISRWGDDNGHGEPVFGDGEMQ
jgi:hypothetical protein